MLVLYRARNLKKLSLFVLSHSPFLFSFTTTTTPFWGEFCGQPVVSGAIDLWEARDVKYAPFGEFRRGCKMDACGTGGS